MLAVGAIIDRPQQSANPKRATNGRPYKRISAETLFSLPICDIMGYRRADMGFALCLYNTKAKLAIKQR
jgi:hypothetical protein